MTAWTLTSAGREGSKIGSVQTEPAVAGIVEDALLAAATFSLWHRSEIGVAAGPHHAPERHVEQRCQPLRLVQGIRNRGHGRFFFDHGAVGGPIEHSGDLDDQTVGRGRVGGRDDGAVQGFRCRRRQVEVKASALGPLAKRLGCQRAEIDRHGVRRDAGTGGNGSDDGSKALSRDWLRTRASISAASTLAW